MTDRHSGYHVILSEDIREDDAEHTINALRMVKGVATVVPMSDDPYGMIACVRRDSDWAKKLQDFIQEQRYGSLK